MAPMRPAVEATPPARLRAKRHVDARRTPDTCEQLQIAL
jgi:hypothetical protein